MVYLTTSAEIEAAYGPFVGYCDFVASEQHLDGIKALDLAALRSGQSVLDVGAGNGRLITRAKQQVGNGFCLAVDAVEGFLFVTGKLNCANAMDIEGFRMEWKEYPARGNTRIPNPTPAPVAQRPRGKIPARIDSHEATPKATLRSHFPENTPTPNGPRWDVIREAYRGQAPGKPPKVRPDVTAIKYSPGPLGVLSKDDARDYLWIECKAASHDKPFG